MKQKILYIMHVDWRWIKQRPHFIAEGLSDFYDVTVVHFCSKRYLFQNPFISDTNNNLNILPAFRLPLYQNSNIYNLNKFYMQIYFKLLLKKYKPDIIWITYPQLYDYIPENNCKIIYDCMDLATGFDFPEYFESKIMDLEEKLVKDSSIVFTSSKYLFNRLRDVYNCQNKLFLIRNAFGGEIITEKFDVEDSEKKLGTYKIGYVGTISKWFDFDNIKLTLDEIKNIEYHLIGPCELKSPLNEERIKLYGVINHEDLYDYVKHFDCFIMPFKLNELVRSVDPVKLYEYINYNKPILSVYYEELDYFSQFISFYSNIDEFINLLKQMVEREFTNKYKDLERIDFLNDNSWNVRINQIKNCLDNM